MAKTKGSKPKTRKVMPDTITKDGVEYKFDRLEIRDRGEVKKGMTRVRQFCRDIDEGEINMNPLIQRTDNQWTPRQKTKMIISLLKERPIGAITTAVVTNPDGTVDEILVDGLQRLTALHDFINDKFKLTKDESVIVPVIVKSHSGIETTEYVDFGGKYFSQFPDVFKRALLNANIDHHQYCHYPDEEIEDIMFCMNNGTPFKPWQKIRTKLGNTRIEPIQEILDGAVWSEIKGANEKTDSTLGCVIRSMMLLDSTGYSGLGIGAAGRFIDALMQEKTVGFSTKVAEVAKLYEDLEQIVITLGQQSENDLAFFDVTNTPHIIANLAEFNRQGKPLELYIEFIHKFINGETDNQENNITVYRNIKKNSVGSGSASLASNSIEAKQWVLDYAMHDYCCPEEKNVEIEDDSDYILDAEIVETSNEVISADENYDPQTLLDFDEVIIPSASDDKQEDYQDYNIHYVQNDDHDNIYEDNDDFSDETENSNYASASSY